MLRSMRPSGGTHAWFTPATTLNSQLPRKPGAGFATRARAEAERTGTRAATTQLTSSELRVAQLAATGGTNREIAEALFISPKTVEANLARVYRKLDIGRRAELGAALSAVTEAPPKLDLRERFRCNSVPT